MTQKDYRYVKLCVPLARHYQSIGVASPQNISLALVYGLLESICRSNEYRRANPKRKTIAERTLLDVKTVQRCLTRLRDDGFINRIGYKGRIPIYQCTEKIFQVAEPDDLFEMSPNGKPETVFEIS